MQENVNLETQNNIADFENQILENSKKIEKIKKEVGKKVIGQKELIDNLLIGLFAKGHVLLEGVPGLAKTLTVNTLSKTLDLGFNRVQFTPDLLPSDLVGSEIYNSKTGSFEIKKGPIFNNFILADEINRAPSKVQSALLEAMAEKQITIGNHSFLLDSPFIVLATQNPIEQSGTYKLPEAQLDRFMLKVNISYPSYDEELELYKNVTNSKDLALEKILNKEEIFEIQKLIKNIFISDSIYEYVTNIIDASRNPDKYNLEEISKYIKYGISPRGGLSVLDASRVVAFLNGRTYVIPEDIKKIAKNALSHRIVLSYEAIAEEINEEFIIKKIIDNINVV